MGWNDFIQFFLFIGVLIALTPVLGKFMAKVFQGERTILHKPLSWLERGVYAVVGVKPEAEMTWKRYAFAFMMFQVVGIVFVMLIQMIQSHLPWNPQGLGNVSWDSAFNTAVSFVTNTNWQGYAGETTMSYFTQMVALSVQNFVSAASGLAIAIVLIRGISRRSSTTLGNFWVDLTRGTLYVFLPLSIIYTLFLVSQGVVQTLAPSVTVTTLEGLSQVIPLGPAASQIAIKLLGTNGGGFFNANAAHPFENPTALSNFMQMLSIFVLASALTYTYGVMSGSRRQGWAIFAAMLAMFVVLTSLSLWSETHTYANLPGTAPMEGKETRFGIFHSVFFSSVTTAASCGAVNAMHSSLTPISGGIALLNMMVGEVIFGGVGAGLYGMLLFALLTVFIAGLMVGRTPEYLGKKIEAREMMMVILAVLAPCATILLGTALAVASDAGLSSLSAKGPHGFTEVLYALTSAAANNGSAFAGLNANTVFYNLLLGVAMLIGRFGIILPVLAIAGSLAQKKFSAASVGTFKTDNALFVMLLIAVILVVGALTFLPALSLGPVVEHLLLLKGKSF